MIEAIKKFKTLGLNADSYRKALEIVNDSSAAYIPLKAVRRKYEPGTRYRLPSKRVR